MFEPLTYFSSPSWVSLAGHPQKLSCWLPFHVFCCCFLEASMGWVVCEMTGHANKLHHFWLSGQGQCHAICQSGGLWVEGWMGLISMCSLRSLTPLPKPPDSKLSVTTTLTPKKLCREAALASGVTQTYELTHQPLAKTKHPEIHFNTRVGLRSVIVSAVDRVISDTHCTHYLLSCNVS